MAKCNSCGKKLDPKEFNIKEGKFVEDIGGKIKMNEKNCRYCGIELAKTKYHHVISARDGSYVRCEYEEISCPRCKYKGEFKKDKPKILTHLDFIWVCPNCNLRFI